MGYLGKDSSLNILVRVSLFGALSATLFIFEGLAPRPIPWMKLGIGNIPVVVALTLYGPVPAFIVCFVKLTIGGLIGGLIAGPVFIISVGGTIASWFVMSLCSKLPFLGLGPIGVSIWGACSHQATQLIIAYVFVGQFAIFSLFPVALLSAVVTGIFIGCLAFWVLRLLSNDSSDK